MPAIYQFNHAAMATHFQARIAHDERSYAAQASQAAFNLVDALEASLSRFRVNSEITRIADVLPGTTMRLSEPTFACLEIAKRMELATQSAFSPTPFALKAQPALPQWELRPESQSIVCISGRLEFDLGAIGKGFALDCIGGLLGQWDCPSFLLIAGGSSILAGDAPLDAPGWSCGLGEDNAALRFFLAHASLSGSGLAVKGAHILDPRTGRTALRQNRSWVLADTGAESDAISTACMVLSEPELEGVLTQNASWLAFLDTDNGIRPVGSRPLPMQAK
jgi:thiamine biosynthesis lipoprotein